MIENKISVITNLVTRAALNANAAEVIDYFGYILTKNVDPDKCGYSKYDIRFDLCSQFSLNGELGENVIIFGIGNRLPLHTDNRKKVSLVVGKGPMNVLDYTTVTSEAKYYVNIAKPR